MFVMMSSALWLFLTVAVLNMHHKNPDKHPPRLLEIISLRIIARLLCMKTKVNKSRYKAVSQKEPCLYNGLSQHFRSISFVSKEETSEADSISERLTWIKLAKIFDRFFLVLFSFLDTLAIALFLCYYPLNLSTIPHPKDMTREQIYWNHTTSSVYPNE